MHAVIMFETSMMVTVTDHAMNSDKRGGTFWIRLCDVSIRLRVDYIAEHVPGMWNDLGPNFLKHTEKVNADLKAAGLPLLRV